MAGGICVASVSKTDDGARGKARLVVYGDTSNITALASQHFYTSGFWNIWVPYASMAIPVPTGKSFEFVGDPASSVPSFECRYVPFIAAAPDFGSWSSLLTEPSPSPAVDSPTYVQQTASSDGFLLASIDCSATDGSRGYIELQHQVGTSYKRLAGATAHRYSPHDRYVPWNSFCVPIPNGTEWQLAYETTSNAANFNAWWIPFVTPNATPSPFGTPVPAAGPTQVTSDGFLDGWVRAGNDGDRGTLTLRAGPNQTLDPDDPSCIQARASAHYWTSNDMHIRTNSAMIPVKQGWWYQAIQETSNGHPSFGVRFTPATNLFTAAS
jgi:hypothetical protein